MGLTINKTENDGKLSRDTLKRLSEHGFIRKSDRTLPKLCKNYWEGASTAHSTLNQSETSSNIVKHCSTRATKSMRLDVNL